MRIPTLCLKSALLITVIAAPVNAMYKKPHNPFEQDMQRSTKQTTRISLQGNKTGKQQQSLCLTNHSLNDLSNRVQTRQQKPQQKAKQAQKPSQERRLTTRSFNDFPTHIQIHVADYLGYHDQFRLAQTSREQLFLWGSVTRIPESVPLITATSDVTRFNWDDQVWPTTMHPTVIIRLDRSLEDDEDLCRLQRFDAGALNSLLHLHFEGQQNRELVIDISHLLQENEFSQQLQNLRTLGFHEVRPEFHVVGSGLPNLENFLIRGRALPSNKTSLGAAALFFFRPHLRHLSLVEAGLQPVTIRGILSNVDDEHLSALRNIEMTGPLPRGLTSRRNGIDFRLLPWVNQEDILRFHLRSSREQPFIPGPSRLLFTHVQTMDGQNHRLAWNRLLMFLSPHFIRADQLINTLRTRSISARLAQLRGLIGEMFSSENDMTILRLPVRLDACFRNFLGGNPFHVGGNAIENNENREDRARSHKPLKRTAQVKLPSLQTTTNAPQKRTLTTSQQKNTLPKILNHSKL